jgi:hypothetical protein
MTLGDGTLGSGTLGDPGVERAVPTEQFQLENIPHLALPLRIQNRRYAVNEQDSTDELADCVRAICLTAKEFRPEQPEFGIRDPTFQTMPINTNDIINSIAQFEDRVDVEVEVLTDPTGIQSVNIKILHPEEDEEA